MRLIIGLGNPGKAYQHTRHNLGFLLLDALAEKYQLSFKADRRFKGELAKGVINGIEVLLLKPMTFMNLSGDAARLIMHFYKLAVESLLVVYDDVAIPFGQIRLKARGGHGGHNGIKHMQQVLKTQEFPRLKMGIGNQNSADLADYVLEKFTGPELQRLPTILQEGMDWLEKCLVDEIDKVLKNANDLRQQTQALEKKTLKSPPDGQQEFTHE